jgi:hypothetical protein
MFQGTCASSGNLKAVQAPYRVASVGESHAVTEELLPEAKEMLCARSGEKAFRKMCSIPLGNNTGRPRTGGTAENVKESSISLRNISSMLCKLNPLKIQTNAIFWHSSDMNALEV